jgi:hypothetical protein
MISQRVSSGAGASSVGPGQFDEGMNAEGAPFTLFVPERQMTRGTMFHEVLAFSGGFSFLKMTVSSAFLRLFIFG